MPFHHCPLICQILEPVDLTNLMAPMVSTLVMHVLHDVRGASFLTLSMISSNAVSSSYLCRLGILCKRYVLAIFNTSSMGVVGEYTAYLPFCHSKSNNQNFLPFP